MKFSICLLTGLLVWQAGILNVKAFTSPIRAGANLAQEQSAAQSPELVEANQLSEKVVGLLREGKYDEAAVSAKRALKIYEKVLAADSQELVQPLNNLALALAAKGEHDEAKKLLQRVLAIREKSFGPKSAEVIQALYNLAVAYDNAEDYKKAEPLFARVLASQTEISSLENQDGATLLLRYSCVLRRMKNQEQADELEGRALKILYKVSNGKIDEVTFPGTCANSKAIAKPAPRYPREAIASRLQGEVKVKVMVDETGKVISATPLTGHELLRQASVAAAYQAKFKPMVIEGKPVKVKSIITYHFTL